MNEPVLPGLPEPIRNKHGVPLFSSTQVGALQIATWNAAMDWATKAAEAHAVAGAGSSEYGEGYRHAAANLADTFRRAPDPVEAKC